MFPDETSLDKGLDIARALFEKIGSATFDGTGYTRAAYGDGEQLAHDAVKQAAIDLGLHIETDAALNLWMSLEGKQRGAKPLLIGSHLDAVPCGGNYDGLAGVLAGLATLAAFRESGLKPNRDLTLLAIRAEESAWFGAQHIGSRSILGGVNQTVLDEAKRVDSGRTLRQHMIEAGVDLSKIEAGIPLLDPNQLGGYIELHIEQGPFLLDRNLPIGIVTGIRGNRRCRRIVCSGEYGHSGTVSRTQRRDAVFAVSELVTHLDEFWRRIEEDERKDMVLTFGRFSTDPQAHAVTTVPGKVEFSFDVRSHSQDVLQRTEAALRDKISEIERRRNVSFDLDPLTGDHPAAMDPGFQDILARGCRELSIPATEMASGAGHDAGDFAGAGVPAAMVFIRSENGSHNPDEHMEFEDFAIATRLLTWFAGEMSEARL